MKTTTEQNNGMFYTPKLFCDKAHRMIEEQFGEDWKENYVVWDCAAGTLNLTRDYYFKELYCSTLFDSELEIGKNYNKEATKFQFDFLNDYFPMPNDLISEGNKVPDGLVQALKENKPFIFFINPPYGTCSNWSGKQDGKAGINDTNVRKQMREDGLGAGAENLQHQFLYRICKIIDAYHLTNVKLALFSNPIYISSKKQKDFLKFLCNHFSFLKGIMLCASEFSDVSDRWGISFNLWENGKTEDIHNFVHTLVEKNEDNEIVEVAEKNIYNVWKNKLMSQWVREPIKNINVKNVDKPTLNNALTIRETDTKIYDGALGYFHNNANSIQYNCTYVGLYSSTFAAGHGLSILPQNFLRCTAAFSARKLIEGNWINDKDEYLAPNEHHPNYREFELDSVVYSLFNTSSNQSSLRNVEYKGKNWNIKNEFFFLSKDEMLNLANENSNNELFTDARTDTDRFVYKFIEEHKNEFSAEALEVLQAAKDLVYKSFKYRQMFNDEEPKYQINNWDCGWYQIKALCKMFCPDDLKAFQALYKKFADKLRPQVYELGFLRKR